MSTETTGAPSPRPWAWSEDKTRWTAETAGGVPLSIERLEDGDEDGNGASFLPRAGEATGPICDGVLSAAQWIDQYLDAAPCGLCRLRAERGVEQPPGGCTCQAGAAK